MKELIINRFQNAPVPCGPAGSRAQYYELLFLIISFVALIHHCTVLSSFTWQIVLRRWHGSAPRPRGRAEPAVACERARERAHGPGPGLGSACRTTRGRACISAVRETLRSQPPLCGF
ncbi:hypothetical protein JZ751_004593 [Albula glossodonta]|uniref:Uncharacterized protein n=1 Tax=Albula glossodonta TaxID=121402 RepID=A0A8T2N644_9TELE|nr:hypothetical protein JZ751_004593 [Albula glossodonta]